jgi:hypothetical protein
MFVSVKGSSYTWFRGALRTGNLTLIRAAAAELPHVRLDDALTVCMAIRDAEPERFERAALRWIARYAVEQAPDVTSVLQAAQAFERMPAQPEEALTTLQRLCA